MLLQSKTAVPTAYTSESRDFQLLEHLFDAAINTSKLAIDAFDPSSRVGVDDKFIDLACRTVGFFNKGDYESATMLQVISSFKSLMRDKGRLSAVEDVVKLLLNSQHISKSYLILPNTSTATLEIYLPKEVKNVGLMEELFDYILPVGYTYSIFLQDVSNTEYSTILTVSDTFTEPKKLTDAEITRLNYTEKSLDELPTPAVNISTAVSNKY